MQGFSAVSGEVKMKTQFIYKSDLGNILIEAEDKELTAISFSKKKATKATNNSAIKKCVKQLDEYFKGKRASFDLPLKIEGTDFQKKVWRGLTRIPYGETRSYGQIAKVVKSPLASRAVGGANNKNKFAIVIPCHRVIGSTGKLVGYASGLGHKEQLLNLESK
jgi:methylated-DNA-[protein]-cysteine S-methyltransferase